MAITKDLHVKHAKLPAGMDEQYLTVMGHENLCLRVRRGGKAWFFRYKPKGSRLVKKLQLGSYPEISLKEAQDQAAVLRKQLAEGLDPHSERAREKAQQAAEVALKEALPQNVEELFNLWEKRALSSRKDGGIENRRKFKKDVFPRLRGIPLDLIRRAHIVRILDDVKSRGAPRIAGILLSDMRQMFSYALEREIMETDPTAGLKKSKIGGNAKERERVLSEEEIKTLTKTLPTALQEMGQRAVWIMLSTGCRIGEVTSARWENVDTDGGEWLIPADDSKNGKELKVSLSAFAVAQFKAIRDKADADAKEAEKEISEWVMPARHNKGSVCPKSLAKQIADRQRGNEKSPMTRRSPLVDALILPGGKWTPHDLRRTAATLMASLGVRPDVIERCLNHTEQNKIQRIYQRADLRPEMAEAWRLLGERLELLTSATDNVVTLKRTG